MSARAAGAGGRCGFTLIEVLVALAIVAALGMLAVPTLRPPRQAQLRADTGHLAAALRITRSAAMAQNREMTFLLDTARRTFGSQAVPKGILDPETVIVVEGSEGLRTGPVGGIRFLASGRSTGGRIRLERGPFRTGLHVIWATGNVVVED